MHRKMFDRQSWIRILCVVSLVLLSFAHRPVDLNSTFSPIGSAYALTDDLQHANNQQVTLRTMSLPDGTVLVICTSESSGDPAGTHHADMMASCEACRISAGVILPLPEKSAGPVVQVAQSSGTLWQAPELPIAAIYPPAAPPQAPPVV